MIRAVVVDDEPYASQALQTLLKKHCPDVLVEAACYSAQEAEQRITELKPQLVFLDIEMPHRNGFELLEHFMPASFQVIFTTSYDQYAIKAIRFSALDYLLKPIDPRELQAAVAKVRQDDNAALLPAQLQLLLQSLREPATPASRIALPTLEGLQMLTIDTILYCMASSNYTTFVMKDKKKLVISRTLKEIEEMLKDHGFLRIHHSHLVNINAIEKYTRGEGGTVTMIDDVELDVSRSRKEALLKTLQSRK
ncbi:MAG TPA: LytTR family DNA-binding domain-containing protein [Chitinophagaceae bacterium]|jgi:two-component system LytT family response regulator|nr:LytTR family DNA-binding domain-containing protein [Chitinophagaceae bacterium]